MKMVMIDAASIMSSSNNTNTHDDHTKYIKGYDLPLNSEQVLTHSIMLNETMLFCVELNSSTAIYKYSIDILLQSSGFSLYIDINNAQLSSTKGKYKQLIGYINDSVRVTSPISASSEEVSKIYILAVPLVSKNASSAEKETSRELKVSLRVLISEYSLTGGAISFLALLLIVVIGIIVLLMTAALLSCTKQKPCTNEKAFELEEQDHQHDQHGHDVTSTHYYTNAAHLDRNV